MTRGRANYIVPEMAANMEKVIRLWDQLQALPPDTPVEEAHPLRMDVYDALKKAAHDKPELTSDERLTLSAMATQLIEHFQ